MRLASAAALPLLALLGACGNGGSPVVSGSGGSFAPTADASATPGGAGEVLFAVLEPGIGRANTVAVVGLDGFARVKARFDSIARPQIGNAAPILPVEAHVAAGSVFYVDRLGVVRALTPGRATPEVVTTFPAGGSQQEVGFAVDPSGRHLVATVLTLPPLLAPSPPDCPICRSFGDQSARVDVEIADRGGMAHTVRTVETGGDRIQQRLDVVAWDDRGPVAALDQVLGAQYGVPGWDAHIAHLDAAGKPGALLGGGCKAAVEVRDGTLICNGDQEAGVRDASGHVRLAPIGLYGVLSDDGSRVAYSDQSGSHAGAIGGKLATLPRDFTPQGFIGDGIVVGHSSARDSNGDLLFIRLSAPLRVEDLGFRGDFVGTVQAGGG